MDALSSCCLYWTFWVHARTPTVSEEHLSAACFDWTLNVLTMLTPKTKQKTEALLWRRGHSSPPPARGPVPVLTGWVWNRWLKDIRLLTATASQDASGMPSPSLLSGQPIENLLDGFWRRLSGPGGHRPERPASGSVSGHAKWLSVILFGCCGEEIPVGRGAGAGTGASPKLSGTSPNATLGGS